MRHKTWSVEEIRDLGVTTDLVTAGQILGIGRGRSYELARNGQFPVEVLHYGRRIVVPVSALLAFLGAETTTTT